jgi:C4-dicarboxylate-specific signal transduction histidine kinase
MDDIIKGLQRDLSKQSIRERAELLEPLKAWHKTLVQGMVDLNNALQFVKSEAVFAAKEPTDSHDVVLRTVEMWYNYMSQHNCKVMHELRAEHHLCLISRPALKEIISVLIVNSVQAHAKTIRIHDHNETECGHGNDFIELAWCMDFVDDGDGLATETPEDIFSSTYTTKPGQVGSGLGLFIAKKLARNFGGDLVVKHDKRVHGVSFRLNVPVFKE